MPLDGYDYKAIYISQYRVWRKGAVKKYFGFSKVPLYEVTKEDGWAQDIEKLDGYIIAVQIIISSVCIFTQN